MDAELTGSWMSVWTLDAVVKVSVVVLVAAGLSRVLKNGRARTRHAVWAAALVAALAMPAVSATLLVLGAPMLPGPVAAATRVSPAPGVVPPVPIGRGAREPQPASQPVPRSGPESARHAGPDHAGPGIAVPSLGRVALVLWLTGVALLLARAGVSLIRLCRLAASGAAHGLDPSWRRLLDDLTRELGLRRAVRLVEVDANVSPLTFGWRRPVVVVPRDARAWPGERRRMALLHELLHVRRHDWPLHVLARLVRALHWFNPLVWLAVARLGDESEQSCDEAVVDRGIRASDYADCLLTLARTAFTRHRERSEGGLTMLHRTVLQRRIENVLTARRAGGPATPVLAAPVLAAVAVTALVLAATSPWGAAATRSAPESGPTARQDAPRDEKLAGLASRTIRHTVGAGDGPVRIANFLGRMTLVAGDRDRVEIVAKAYARDETERRLGGLKWIRTRDAEGRAEWSLDMPYRDYERLHYPRFERQNRNNSKWNEHPLEITGDPEAPVLFADLVIAVPADVPVQVRGGTGEVRGHDLEGRVSIHLSAGPVRLDSFHGTLAVESGAGAVAIRGGEIATLAIGVGAGSIVVDGARIGDASLETGAGTITVETRLADAERIDARTGSGAIKVLGEADASFDARVHVGIGTFRNRYDGKVEKRGGSSRVSRGSGGVQLTLSCGAGECVIGPAGE